MFGPDYLAPRSSTYSLSETIIKKMERVGVTSGVGQHRHVLFEDFYRIVY
jgi:6-phosphogluconolactonase (cycloisomerase 2 family)